jgi:pimeloyl-ACP methyl ester carboxylesterase
MRLIDPRPFAREARRAVMTAHLDEARDGNYVHTNGIETYYVEKGDGASLILLYNGMISTSPVWNEWPSSYSAYLDRLAEHFRVIAIDFRGSGKTVHPGGPISYDLLADDVIALIDALDLDRPMIGGYGDGGMVATIVGVRQPESVRAIVNDGGYDLLNPDPNTAGLIMTRQMLGGSADATRADPDVVAGSEHTFLRTMVSLMQADHDATQGDGHWKSVLGWGFDRFSQPSGYTTEDLRAITVPTLIIAGDRDPFCTVEEGAKAYRALRAGELAILPNTAVGITPTAIEATIDFFERHLET